MSKLFKSKRATVLSVILISILVGSVVYALMVGTHTFTNVFMIKGVNIKVMSWISDTTPPTTIVTSHDWNSLAQGETVYYEYVCLKNSGTANLTLAFTSTLNATFGTVTWWIEWYDSGWIWKDWQKSINEAEPPSVPGQNAKPMLAGQTLGMRPATPLSLSAGRIRIELKASASAPIGELTNFDITVTGTEKV